MSKETKAAEHTPTQDACENRQIRSMQLLCESEYIVRHGVGNYRRFRKIITAKSLMYVCDVEVTGLTHNQTVEKIIHLMEILELGAAAKNNGYVVIP